MKKDHYHRGNGKKWIQRQIFTYSRKFLFAAIGLFFVEVAIALFVRDRIIRPYGGDFLVVLFLYCLLKGLFKISELKAILLVLSFSYLVEWMQYLELRQLLLLENNVIAQTVLGTKFEWLDMLIYTLAAFFIFIVEKVSGSGKKKMSKKGI